MNKKAQIIKYLILIFVIFVIVYVLGAMFGWWPFIS